MIDVAFKVKVNSLLNRDFFRAKKEAAKFETLATAFCEKYFGSTQGRDYEVSESLIVSLTLDEREKYAEQICKSPIMGHWQFRRGSELQNRWNEEVVFRINWERLRAYDAWWTRFGSCTYGLVGKELWENADGAVFGCLKMRYGSAADMARYQDVKIISMREYREEQRKYWEEGDSDT